VSFGNTGYNEHNRNAILYWFFLNGLRLNLFS